MAATHRDPGLGRRWLAEMGKAAASANVSIQYCMTLPRELLQVQGIVSRDFGTLFLFHWIDLKVIIGPDQVYFSF
jgi:hypothetical protein